MLHKMAIFIYNSFKGGPAAGRRWCTYYGVVGGLSGTASIMTIAMMSVERYACVSRPLDPSSRMTKSRAILMVVIVWIYSSIFSFLPLFGINRYVPEGYLTSCSFDYLSDNFSSKVFVLVFFGAAYCVPLLIICRCYTGIVFSVYKNQQLFMQHSNSPSVPDRNIENHKRLEIRLAKISFRLISLWTVAWTPYAIVALLGTFNSRHLLTPLASMLPAVFCKFASVLDPFVYALSNQQFKDELARKLLCICRCHWIKDTRTISNFIKRAIVVEEASVTLENADLSLSDDEDEQCETSLNGKKFQLSIRKVFSMNALELAYAEPLKDKSVQDNGVYHHSDSELNNNRMLTSFLPQGQINLHPNFSNPDFGRALTVEESLPLDGKTNSNSSVFKPELNNTQSVPEKEVHSLGVTHVSTIYEPLVHKHANNVIRDKISNDWKLSRLKSFETNLHNTKCDTLIQKHPNDDKITNVRKIVGLKNCDSALGEVRYDTLIDKPANNVNRDKIPDVRKLSRLKRFHTSLQGIRLNQYSESGPMPINKSTFVENSLLQKFIVTDESSSLEDAMCSELIEMNKVELESIQIPQVYTIERQNDIIKLKPRRSF